MPWALVGVPMSIQLRLFLVSCDRSGGGQIPSDLYRLERWVPLHPLAAPVAGGRGISFCSRSCLLWCVVGMVGAAPKRINLSQLHSRTDDELHDSVSELMKTCACRSFRSIAWSFRYSLDFVRYVSHVVAFVFTHGGVGGQTEVDALEQRCWSADGGSVVILQLRQ
jgi:hypothetical protein